MPKKVLITGVTGFAGSFLAEYLVKTTDYSIAGTYLTEESLSNVKDLRGKITCVQVNLLDEHNVHTLIQSEKPDYIYHLAALTSPLDSFKNPAHTITNNMSGQINILEALRQENLSQTRVLIVSSADIYGIVAKKDLPIDEDTPFMPTNPYSVSKIAQDFLALQYFLAYKLPLVRVRPFNHIGPRQAPAFVISSFAKQIAEIEKGIKNPILSVGNLEAERDFTDVRDMVRAYHEILEKGEPGEVYNIGSGVSYKISKVLDMLLSLSKVSITVKEDPEKIRPLDTPYFVCDARKIHHVTHWKPTFTLDVTLKDTLDYWRNIV